MDIIIKVLPILVAYEDKGADLVLKKINTDIASERERQRQREAEERERQRRQEAEAHAELNVILTPASTIPSQAEVLSADFRKDSLKIILTCESECIW